jgi:hypothetical protein
MRGLNTPLKTASRQSRRRLMPLVCLIAAALVLASWRWLSVMGRRNVMDGEPVNLPRRELSKPRGGRASQGTDGEGEFVAKGPSTNRKEDLEELILLGREHLLRSPGGLASASTSGSSNQVIETRNFSGESPRVRRRLEWNRSLYLPVDNDVSLAAFRRYEAKQAKRVANQPNVTAIKWGSLNSSRCLDETPECEFFLNISCPVTFHKCCAEHMRLKQVLFYVLDVAERHHVQLFLDSGTLLSAWRDGGDTLVPWETDIDLGVVGSVAGLVAEPFLGDAEARRRRLSIEAAARRLDAAGVEGQQQHLFQPCSTVEALERSRRGKPAAPPSDGAVAEHCNDAHYVYYQPNASMAKVDTCRVEIWPYGNPMGEAYLLHATRPHLNVPTEVVLPLSAHGGRCRIWGRQCLCPHDPERYLNQWYPENNWKLPQTIHWNENNAPAWRSELSGG